MDKYIKESIRNFITNDCEKVICISGEWGVGKTFLVFDVLNQLKDITYKYASVFGKKN